MGSKRVGHDWVITLSLSWCIYKRIQRWDGNKHQKIINYKKQKLNNNKKSELPLRFQAWMTTQQSHKRYTSGIWRWKAGILLAIMGWCTTGRQRQLADSWKCRPVVWVQEHYCKCRLESCSPRKLLTLELNWNYDITKEGKEDKEEIRGGSWGNDGILRFKKS